MKKPEVSERFFQSFDDPSIFDCNRFNLLKVAQDALIRESGKKGFFATYFDKPNWFLRLIFKLKSARKGHSTTKTPESLINRKLLIIIPPRFIPSENGEPKLMYFENLRPHLTRENHVLMYLHTRTEVHEHPDLTLQEFMQQYDAFSPNKEEFQFLSNLRKCYRRIQTNGRFSTEELNHIKTGFDEFWRQYRALKRGFAHFKFKKAVLIPGYYTEYLIAALKVNNIEVIEIQHGVIAPASHFYIYPPQVKAVVHKALFADRIWVFGDFWKQQLLKGSEFTADKISVLGDYFFRKETPPSTPHQLESFAAQFPRLLLIGTQTKRHQQFIELINGLSEKYLREKTEFGIVLKPHPAEDPELYAEVSGLSNVLLTDASLDFLYPKCEAYVSMYSNTLFEATRFPALSRFVLWTEETSALSEAIAASGVAKQLKNDQDPMEHIASVDSISPTDLYTELNVQLIQSLDD